MTVLTREIINKNITYNDIVENYQYSFNELSKEIDFFKNLFQENGVDGKTSKSIVIGFPPGIQQTACIFACFELSIIVCIIDYGRADKFTQYKYIDPKTELLLPIDFFIVFDELDTDKFNYFKNICNKTIVVNQLSKKDYSSNKTIHSTGETVLIRCTSSGTTGTPKVVEHTHEFIYHLSIRNSKFYDKTVAIGHNLNHGSSFATFFIPVIRSTLVNEILNFNQDISNNKIKSHLHKINHVMIPYSYQVLDFLQISSSNIILYTLGAIPSRFLEFYQDKKIKDIISFFGCNETSGPTLINRISSPEFDSSRYWPIDDFYFIFLRGSKLQVKLPYYRSKIINTKDIFRQELKNSFIFLGRTDLIKINGLVVSMIVYEKFLEQEKIENADIIYDITENKIYLAIWQDYNKINETVKNIDEKIRNHSENLHYISKYKVLDKSEFMSGIKIDNELIRHYFRKYVA
jgi:acyl-coenzyme A synthetase/AMP-(fatty) acid ligase